MKKVIYVYLLATMADWEMGYVLQGLSMQGMLKEEKFIVKTVGKTKEPIKTLGGLTVVPDCTIEEIGMDDIAALLLPGADTWVEGVPKSILDTIVSCINNKILVGAICGATLALADLGILNNRLHTSNSKEYLCSFSKNYTGTVYYVEERSVVDCNIITASSAGGLQWAKLIMEYLNIYSHEIIQNWYNYYLTGDAKYYMGLLSAFEKFKVESKSE